MYFSQLGAVAALAAVGHTFLIPPSITPTDNEVIKTLPFDAQAVVDGRLISIVCPGCPVDVTNLEGVTKSATSRVDSKLLFNFSIEQSDADHLILNGFQLYPVDPSSQSFMEPLTADQLVETSEGNWNYAATPKLGYALSIQHPETPNGELGLVALRLEIIELGRTFMTGFPIIDVKLLETTSGKLMIGDVAVKEAEAASPESDQECTTIVCKWRAIIAAKIAKFKGMKGKGCGGKARPKHGSSSTTPTIKGGPITHVKPINHGHPRPAHGAHWTHRHHRHHRHGGFARVLRGIVFHVFIPIMIGVVVGIMASIVGMVVGHIAIFIWRMLFRRGQRLEYHRFQHVESMSQDDEDSKSLLRHDNPPPEYEEAPAYEDAVVDEKA